MTRPSEPPSLLRRTALLLLPRDSAAVIRACVHVNSGDLRIVANSLACRRNEVFLEWAAGGPTGGDPAVPPMSVLDATDRAVGPVVSLDSNLNPLVGLTAGTDPYVLLLFQGQLLGSNIVYYLAPDCTGPALLERRTSAIRASGIGADHKVYVDGTDPVASIRPASYFFETCRPAGFLVTVSPAVEALDLAQFTLPFKVR
jgi:hypothetical protein